MSCKNNLVIRGVGRKDSIVVGASANYIPAFNLTKRELRGALAIYVHVFKKMTLFEDKKIIWHKIIC